MASFIKTAAACLVVLSGTNYCRAALPQATEAPPAVYTDLNYARNGAMPVTISPLTQDSTIVQNVLQSLPTLVTEYCSSDTAITPQTAGGFILSLTDASPAYAELIQTALTAGLDAIASNPTATWGSDPWKSNNDAANLGYALWSTSISVGCGVQMCENGTKGVMVCRLNPTVTDGVAPFSQEYYDALKARTKQLKDMTAADLKPPAVTGSGVFAMPSVLLCGLVGILAVASL